MSTNIWHILGAIIIILASIRGALVLHFGFPPTNTYQISALSFILLGFFSFLLIQFKYPNRELILLINVINLNVFFLSFYLVGMISLLGFKYIDMVYLFGIFPIIFWLIEYKHKLLILIVYSALFITGFGVIYFYYVGITSGINGVGEMITTLRPNGNCIILFKIYKCFQFYHKMFYVIFISDFLFSFTAHGEHGKHISCGFCDFNWISLLHS